MRPEATRFRDRIFGTDVSVAGLADPAGALNRLHEIEASLSRFRPESDLSVLNRKRAGRIPSEFMPLLVEAVRWMDRTGGVVTPFLGRTIVALGYDRDFADLTPGRRIADAPGAPEPGTVIIDPGTGWVELPAGVDIDLGGFAKGWAADLLSTFDGSARGLVNVGGDLRAWSDSEPWEIATEGGTTFQLANGAVATSSVLHRAWSTTRGRMHHIVDPRTGVPAATDCVEATVIAVSALSAEALAKLAVLSGMDAAPALLAQLDPSAGWILTDTVGRVERGGTFSPVSVPPPPRKASP